MYDKIMWCVADEDIALCNEIRPKSILGATCALVIQISLKLKYLTNNNDFLSMNTSIRSHSSC
jgi:hypothetical protein